MARTQTLVQLSDELLAQLDARVVREGRSRSELIRDARAGYLAADLDAEIDRRIVASYTNHPHEDLLGAEATGLAMINAEPWDAAPIGDPDRRIQPTLDPHRPQPIRETARPGS